MAIPLRRSAVTAATTAALLVLAACSADYGAGTGDGSTSDTTDAAEAATTEDAGDPVEGGTLRYLLNIEPPTWDTARNPGLALNSVYSNLSAALVAQKADGTFEGWLATDWEVSEDGLVYTFHLRDDVTFSDGEPFDAEAVKANFDRVLDPESGLNAAIRPSEVVVVDELTLQLTFPTPNSQVVHALSTPHLPLISPKVLAEHTSAEIGEDPTLLAGTGPFTVAAYERGSSITLTKRDDYDWAPQSHGRTGAAYLDEVEISFVTEPFTRVNSLESGQVDAIDAVPPLDADSLEAGDFTILQADNSGWPYSVSLNVGLPPLDDPAVREALRSAVNVDGLLEGLYAGWYDKAWTNVTPVTPPLGSYDADLEGTWGYDLEAAKAQLDAAGWIEGEDGVRVKDGQRLTLEWKDDSAFVAQDQRLQLGEGVIASLAEAGIEVNRTQYDSSSYREELAKGTHHLAPSSRGYADVRTAVTPLASEADPRVPGSGINYGLLFDPEIDAWWAELLTETDPEKRIEIAHLVQAKVTEEVYSVPIYVPKKLVGTSPEVHGWLFDAVGYTDTFYNVWIG